MRSLSFFDLVISYIKKNQIALKIKTWLFTFFVYLSMMMKNLKTSSRYVCICTSLLLILLLSLCLFYTYFPSSSRVSISASCESFSSSSSWKQWKEAQATGCCDMIKELENYANTTNGHHLYSRIRQWWLVTKNSSQIVSVFFF